MDGRVERDVRMETGGPGELDPRVPPPPGQTRLESSEDWLEDCLETATTKRENLMSGLQRNTISLNKSDDQKERKIASKPHSTPLTLKWLEENYEIAEGVCIPRSTLYMHYLDFCDKNDSQPVNAASFGKIIRQQFPHLTTRRLGTRGQSKYHYYGIGVKETSHYYDVMFSRKGIQECPEGKKHDIKQVVAYSPRSKLGTLLPEFPNVRDIKLPPGVAEDKVTSHTEVNTFLMMYRTHCQRILDTVIRANFDEVQQFLLHFWQGMPGHIVPILGTAPVISLVGVCDSILYKAISGVLMPTVLQALPDSLTQVIRKFARQLDEWLHIALEDLPEPLRQMKFDLARRFSQLLKRQTSLNHLCQASRTVIHSSEITSQMLEDWANVDLASISKQTLYTMDTFTDRELAIIECLYKEFETLLQEQAPIEAYTEWLDSMVDRCVVKPSQKKPGTVRRIARQFLLMWSCFGTRVIRDMTLHSAPSFGSFHLLHLMFDDYVLYLVESIHSNERASELLRAVKGEAPLVDAKDEMILPNPSIGSGGYSTTFHPNSPMSANMERQSVIQDTRDAYNQHYNKDSYAMSPHNPGANQSNSPSQSTSSMMSYDVRCENEATQESPPGDGTAHLSAAPMTGRTDTHGGQGDGYSRYLPMNTSSTQTGDAAYTYGPYNSNVQYGYNREYSGSRGSWTDTQRYSHTTPVPPATTQEVQSNYYNYPYPRGGGTEYDIHSYGYDENVYAAQSMRNQSQSSGAIYPAYGNAIDTYCAETETGSTSKKRKLASFDESGYPTKKTAEYDFSITAAGYQRA